jgi:hypothetical protein
MDKFTVLQTGHGRLIGAESQKLFKVQNMACVIDKPVSTARLASFQENDPISGHTIGHQDSSCAYGFARQGGNGEFVYESRPHFIPPWSA